LLPEAIIWSEKLHLPFYMGRNMEYSSPFASGSSPRGDAPNPEGVAKEASLSSKKDDESHRV